jgi:MinD superfamily P-loop ATPase
LLKLLAELKVPVVGVIENMKMREGAFIRQNVMNAGFPFLGELPFDPKVEDTLGDIKALLKTKFAKRLAEIILKISL